MTNRRVAVIKVDNPFVKGFFNPITNSDAGIRVPMRVVRYNLRRHFKTKNIDLEEVPGYTNCFKCAVDDQFYHVKLFIRENPEILIALKTAVKGKDYIYIYENVCMGVTPFHPFKQLSDYFDNHEELTFGENVKMIAKQMHDLHETTLRTTPIYRHEMEKVYKILNPLKLHNVDVIIDYLRTFDLPEEHCLIHTDIQPKNILIGNEAGYLIDYENAQVGHPYDDFSYLMLTMSDKPEFLKELINAYFDGNVPEDFFKLNSYFVCLKYLLILAETYKMVDPKIIDENTEIIINEFVKRETPSWWN